MRTICPLCEATCGVRVTMENGQPVAVRGDDQDIFSRGYICPKGVALHELASDPDRIREPMIREGETWRTVTWAEAFAAVDAGWKEIWKRYGKESLGVYLGNPSSHNLGIQTYGFPLFKALGTANFFSASTADQMPKHVSTGQLFGDGMSIAIPDINRTDYLLILGANPLESNGSLMTAPDLPERLKDIQRRGGRIVVIDPRRTRTAKMADAYFPIRPATDVLFLAALVQCLFAEGRVVDGGAIELSDGIDALEKAVAPFTPEDVSSHCGIPAESIRAIARELSESPTAAIHARMGTTTQDYGTITSWLVDIIHILTGNLDRPGGAMFTRVAHGGSNTKGTPGKGKGFVTGRRKSRVRSYPEVMGEFPCGAMAEEILTPGPGQIRSMLTVSGNPVLSTPDGDGLDEALASLEFMVSFDIYLNETTRHANVILPDISPLERPHYDLIFNQLTIHNYARYAPAVMPPTDRPAGWQVLLQLIGIAAGLGPDADLELLDEQGLRQAIEKEMKQPTSRIAHMDVDTVLEKLGNRRGPERIVDFMLRSGPYGDGFDDTVAGLSLDQLEAHPEGIDLGPLEPRLPEILRTPSGRIELVSEVFLSDLAGLAKKIKDTNGSAEVVLVGRRHLRSNNSWMHNVPSLVRGRERCTVLIHPDTAAEKHLVDGARAHVKTDTGQIEVTVEVTEDIMPGVVSVPHGWGHGLKGIRMEVAAQHAGANVNRLVDATRLDYHSGNAVLNGYTVELRPAEN